MSQTFDNLRRLTAKQYPDSTAVSYAYDALSRLMQASDPTGTYAFAYDNLGRLLGTTTNYSFLSRTLSTSYTYDAASNRVSFTDPEGGVTNYTYDSLNRLTGLVDFADASFGFGYDALGRRTSLTRPNAVITSYSYDALSRLLAVLHQRGGVDVDGAAYSYDAVGNRTAETFLQQADPDPVAVTASYSYDDIYQLTQTLLNGGLSESYAYDGVGNRQSSLGIEPWLYNDSDHLTSTPLASFAYDNNGNTTSKTGASGTTQYTWDYENRLTSVTLPGGGSVSFTYDPFGRRIRKVSASGTAIYAYDGDNVVEELDATGGVVARYTQGPGIDEPLAMYRSGTTHFYHADGLGSITSLTNSAGTVDASYVYDSFGTLTDSTGELTNPFRYTARESDSESGLYYYRARYYDPATGRFLSEDPVGYYDGLNLYAYVGNQPTLFVDPSGFTRLKGFPPDKEHEMRAAIQRVKQKLSERCDTNCAGENSRKLLDRLEKATFVYVPRSKSCGQVGPLTFIGIRKRVGISVLAFDVERCDKLECTVIHEIAHISFGREVYSRDLEKKCFDCRVPEGE